MSDKKMLLPGRALDCYASLAVASTKAFARCARTPARIQFRLSGFSLAPHIPLRYFQDRRRERPKSHDEWQLAESGRYPRSNRGREEKEREKSS